MSAAFIDYIRGHILFSVYLEKVTRRPPLLNMTGYILPVVCITDGALDVQVKGAFRLVSITLALIWFFWVLV